MNDYINILTPKQTHTPVVDIIWSFIEEIKTNKGREIPTLSMYRQTVKFEYLRTISNTSLSTAVVSEFQLSEVAKSLILSV